MSFNEEDETLARMEQGHIQVERMNRENKRPLMQYEIGPVSDEETKQVLEKLIDSEAEEDFELFKYLSGLKPICIFDKTDGLSLSLNIGNNDTDLIINHKKRGIKYYNRDSNESSFVRLKDISFDWKYLDVLQYRANILNLDRRVKTPKELYTVDFRLDLAAPDVSSFYTIYTGVYLSHITMSEITRNISPILEQENPDKLRSEIKRHIKPYFFIRETTLPDESQNENEQDSDEDY